MPFSCARIQQIIYMLLSWNLKFISLSSDLLPKFLYHGWAVYYVWLKGDLPYLFFFLWKRLQIFSDELMVIDMNKSEKILVNDTCLQKQQKEGKANTKMPGEFWKSDFGLFSIKIMVHCPALQGRSFFLSLAQLKEPWLISATLLVRPPP